MMKINPDSCLTSEGSDLVMPKAFQTANGAWHDIVVSKRGVDLSKGDYDYLFLAKKIRTIWAANIEAAECQNPELAAFTVEPVQNTNTSLSWAVLPKAGEEPAYRQLAGWKNALTLCQIIRLGVSCNITTSEELKKEGIITIDDSMRYLDRLLAPHAMICKGIHLVSKPEKEAEKPAKKIEKEVEQPVEEIEKEVQKPDERRLTASEYDKNPVFSKMKPQWAELVANWKEAPYCDLQGNGWFDWFRGRKPTITPLTLDQAIKDLPDSVVTALKKLAAKNLTRDAVGAKKFLQKATNLTYDHLKNKEERAEASWTRARLITLLYFTKNCLSSRERALIGDQLDVQSK
jgi:hypothetical protein